MGKDMVTNLAAIMTPENIQKYILGTKKNGAPRAIYDIVKDCSGKKKKKKHKHQSPSTYDFYFNMGKKKKKHKKKKKSDKYWHI